MRGSADIQKRSVIGRGAALVAVLSLMLALSVPASATVTTWDNDSGDNKWDTAINWDTNAVPDLSLDDVVFPAGGPYTITLANNFNLNPASGRTVTLNSAVTFHGAVYSMTFDNADQLQGSGTLQPEYSNWGSHTFITAGQPNFAGGFNLIPGYRRETYLRASAPDAMGTGAATATGFSRFDYTWGAQRSVGGVTAGITVGGHAVIDLNGTIGDPSTLRERFTVNANGVLLGTATELGYVTRVSSFSASPSGAEAILGGGAVIVNTDHTTGSVANLGANADLLYGIAGTLDDAGFSLNVGAGTPWKGIGTDVNTGFKSSTSNIWEYFKQGTIVIDDGGGSFTELLLDAPGADYGSNPAHFAIGDGGKAPAFQSASGSDPVGLRTREGWFHLNSPNVDFSGINEWTLEDDVQLILNEALPGDNTNLDDLLDLVLESGAQVDTTDLTTYVRTLTLGPNTYTSGTYTNSTNPGYIKGTGSIIVVPEPATLGLIGLGAGVVLLRRRTRK